MFIKEANLFKLFLCPLLASFFFLSGCFEQCEVLTVINKYKCTFDRDYGKRVCVAKMGNIDQMQKKGIRGRASAAKLPEPLEVGETMVRVCTKEGRKTYEKL